MKLRVAFAALVGLHGCSVTNTGNPGHGGGDAPDGIELVRSDLERERKPSVDEMARMRFAADNQAFAFDLYQQVRGGAENLFFSPYSISVALAMTYAGAQGETEREMATALHFGLAEPSLHQSFNATDLALAGREKELVNRESSGDGFRLSLTNAMFARTGREFAAPFLDTLAQHYGSGMYRVDFAGNPDGSRAAINGWVLEKTEQRIDELLPVGSINTDTAFVLVNAIYFKASWLDEFDPSRTEPQVFHAPSGDVTVPMMHGFAEQYMRGEGYAALELPYVSPATRVLFLLPDEGKLDELERKLTPALFAQTLADLAEHTVDLRVPRFKYEAEFKLKEALIELGMERAFIDGMADFSAMGGAPIYIDQVYHKAFVAMNEEGTEAAAATAVVGRDESAPPPATFTLDRPFLFFIHDKPTGQILFAGRVTTPLQ
jgi:serpin B